MASGKVHPTTDVMSTFPIQDEIQDGKNKHLVKCLHCPSKILNPMMGVYKQLEFSLPHMKQKSDTSGNVDEEVIKDFWFVEDMYAFENVAFTKTVTGMKYLACADCEVGPIGWFDMTAKTSYIALTRVLHEKAEKPV